MKKRLYKVLAEQLKARLKLGVYQMGDKLPTEQDISANFNVSRTVVREAMIMLEVEGWIEVVKGSGAYIIQLPSDTKNAETNDDDDIGPFELLQAKQLLESHIAAFAANQIVKTDLDKLRDLLVEEKKRLSKAQYSIELDEQFHIQIAKATQNTMLIKVMKDLWRQEKHNDFLMKNNNTVEHDFYRIRWMQEHEAIVLALQKKSPKEANDAMWQHIENAKQRIIRKMEEDEPHFDLHFFDSTPVGFNE